MHRLPALPDDRRSGSFDALRLLAMSVIFWQHVASTTEHSYLVDFRYFNFGQLGVAMFIALSGWLAGKSRRSTGDWLWHRFVHVYPPYLLVTLIGLAAAWFFEYKAVTSSLAVAQIFGVAALTHGESIINVPTWFITLLLVCYLGTCAFQNRWYGLASVAAIGLVFVSLGQHGFLALFAAHASTYFAAFWVVRSGVRRDIALLALGVMYALLGFWMSDVFINCWAGMLGLWVCTRISFNSQAWLEYSASRTYEFYLIHGPLIVANVALFGDQLLPVLVCALVTAGLGSILLHGAIRELGTLVSKSHSPLTSGC